MDENLNGRVYAHFRQSNRPDYPVLINLMSIDAIEARDEESVIYTLSGTFIVKESYEEIISLLESLVTM